MDRNALKAILLANGYTEKPQPDGTMDLNPYVYEAMEAVIAALEPKPLTWADLADLDKPKPLTSPCTDPTRENEFIYLAFLADILDNGRYKQDRTKTGTWSVFGRQLRFDLQKGFPLVTTKQCHLRSIIHELLWFLKGDTNIGYLNDNGVGIWDEWAVNLDDVTARSLGVQERVDILYGKINSQKERIDIRNKILLEMGVDGKEGSPELTDVNVDIYLDKIHAELDRMGAAKYGTIPGVQPGDLGPIYGEQWTRWKNPDGTTINQIQYVIDSLLNNPDSRRILVTGWNPSVLPDESVSPKQNVLNGKQALPPCHTLFQFYAEELTLSERNDYVLSERNQDSSLTEANEEFKRFLAANVPYPITGEFSEELTDMIKDWHDKAGTPKHRLSCQLYQRSADSFLGVPFNIASYALLTMMVAQITNMVPGDYIHTFGDAHIYSNHVAQVKEQLSRLPFAAPKMLLNKSVTRLDDFKYEDFTLIGYQSHPAIKGKVAI